MQLPVMVLVKDHSLGWKGDRDFNMVSVKSLWVAHLAAIPVAVIPLYTVCAVFCSNSSKLCCLVFSESIRW